MSDASPIIYGRTGKKRYPRRPREWCDCGKPAVVASNSELVCLDCREIEANRARNATSAGRHGAPSNDVFRCALKFTIL